MGRVHSGLPSCPARGGGVTKVWLDGGRKAFRGGRDRQGGGGGEANNGLNDIQFRLSNRGIPVSFADEENVVVGLLCRLFMVGQPKRTGEHLHLSMTGNFFLDFYFEIKNGNPLRVDVANTRSSSYSHNSPFYASLHTSSSSPLPPPFVTQYCPLRRL